MGEIILENSQINYKLKRIAFQRNISFVISIFCFIFGILYLSTLRGYHGSELIATFKFILFFVIIFTGFNVLYIFGGTSIRVLRYYNKIEPLHFDPININSKFIISKKNQIYIRFSGFVNGVYFIKLKKNEDRSLLNKKPKKLPKFGFRSNKKIKKDNFSIKYGEFSGYFKIPLNKVDYVIGNARVFFMPLALFFKTQYTTEYIIKMIEIIQEKPF
ncbi:MAG: hypothetical protein ACTSPN_13415 [Promethearchaeota archaeon]